MNETVLIVTLVIMAICSIGILYLYIRLQRTMRLDSWANTQDRLGRHRHAILFQNRLAEAVEHHREMQQALLEDGKLTRQRISQIKTRLADEESEDQREKAQARLERRKRAKMNPLERTIEEAQEELNTLRNQKNGGQ